MHPHHAGLARRCRAALAVAARSAPARCRQGGRRRASDGPRRPRLCDEGGRHRARGAGRPGPADRRGAQRRLHHARALGPADPACRRRRAARRAARFRHPDAGRLPDTGRAARRRLAAGAARAPRVSQHRRRQPQRPAGSLRARRRTGARLGQPSRRPRRSRSHQSGLRLRPVAESTAVHRRTLGSRCRTATRRKQTMTHAIRFHQTGGPEVLQLETVDVGDPGPGQARVRHTYIAVNFIDIYFRTGRYPLPLPNGLGSDAVGVVEAVGAGVTDIKVGDRVGYLLGPQGAYAEVRVMPAEVLIPLPAGVSDRAASTLMMKGLTAQYLFRQVYPLKGGETILYHAAAGGVGLIACQCARAIGATMIGTVGSDEKAALANANGCTHTIVYTRESFVERVKAITGGKGVPVVYDSVGKDTLMASLDSLPPRGTLVSNGTTSGPVVIDTTLLAVKGSIWVTRPAMVHYATPRPHMLAMADELFGHVLAGRINGEPKQQFALADAADAHRALESRQTTGATVLVP